MPIRGLRIWLAGLWGLAAAPVWALVDTPETLIVEPGEMVQLSGTIYKSVSIHVKAASLVYLPTTSYFKPEDWYLQLIAPQVVIDGVIRAQGVSFNEKGIGGMGSQNNFIGPGGSGYGGAGGTGNNSTTNGGPIYDSPYQGMTGSRGAGNSFGGGGAIRVDGLSVSIGATAALRASAAANVSVGSGGGGSGGSIVINGVYTFLDPGAGLLANGQQGQLHFVPTSDPTPTPTYNIYSLSSTPTPSPGGGGGGGGRIRAIKYTNFSGNLFNPDKVQVNPGASGGGTAMAGQPGTVELLSAPTPVRPTLIAPSNGQTTGFAPTFRFTTSDPQLSQFLRYEIQVDTETNFQAPLVHTNSQLAPGPGWGGILYYPSNVEAFYALPDGLLSASTTYYWRVRATNNEGTPWSNWSPFWQFTTGATPNQRPVKPVLISPGPGEDLVSKRPALQVMSADPDGNPLTFSIVLSQDPGLLNPKIFQATYPGWDQASYDPGGAYVGVTGTCQVQDTTTYPDTLQPGATYYWQATATDTFEETSRSDIGTFTVVSRPTKPVLAAPADQGVVTTKHPLLTMSSTSPTVSPLRYKLELSSDAFKTIITFLSESSPGWTLTEYGSGAAAGLEVPESYTLVPGIDYSWRVTAYDYTNDNWSEISDAQIFRVITPPLVPTLSTPADGEVLPDLSVPFTFTAVSESGNTLAYRFELSADQFSSVLLVNDQTESPASWSTAHFDSGAAASFQVPADLGLERGRNYAWRVTAFDGVSWGNVSASRSFTLANCLEIRKVKAYPNPAVSRTHLNLEIELSVDADVTLRVVNGIGHTVRTEHFAARGGSTPTVFQLDIGGFASGVYVAVIEAQSLFGTQKSVRRFAVVN